jgi:hypothetical protein
MIVAASILAFVLVAVLMLLKRWRQRKLTRRVEDMLWY